MLFSIANTESNALPDLGYLPQIVLAVYLCVLLLLGYIGYRKSRRSEEDYFLAGRSQGWIVSSLTIMATFFSSWALLGAPGAVYKDGVAFILFALNVPLSGACVYIFGKKIARAGRKRNYVTPGDMIADYYGSRFSLRVLAALVGFLYAVPYIVMQIKAGGVLARSMFPGELTFTISSNGAPTYIFELDAFVIGAIVLSAITMIYIMVGGMRSVAWTDVIQGTLLLTGMLIAGIATITALGGVGGFFDAVSKDLPADAQRVPGPSGTWTMGKLSTLCLFGSVASLIQPAQWMRYYAAKSIRTLRRSAMIFALVLTSCFLFGVMLVGLGGRVLYPPTVTYEVTTPAPVIDGEPTGEPKIEVHETKPATIPKDGKLSAKIKPHPRLSEVGGGDSNDILVVVLRDKGTLLLGALGGLIVSIIFVAIMAASMSTADSNLHALSAVMTRDIFDRFIKRSATERERAWVGRAVIIHATGLALYLVIRGEQDTSFEPVKMIAKMGILAVAFSAQLIPVTVDMLFVRKGSKHGAVFGIIVGLAIVFCFTPFFSTLLGDVEGGAKALSFVDQMRKLIDIGAWGLCGNVVVFVVFSLFTPKPDAGRVSQLGAIMDGEEPKLYQ